MIKTDLLHAKMEDHRPKTTVFFEGRRSNGKLYLHVEYIKKGDT